MIFTILLGIITIILIVCIIFLQRTIHNLENIIYKNEYENTVNKNRISMVEYHFRNYKEGENAFTVLRKIGDVLKMNKEEVSGYKQDE